MDSLVTYIPLYVALALALAGVIYSRKRPSTARTRRVTAFLIGGAMVVGLGSAIVQLSIQAFTGSPGYIVPLLLLVLLAGLLLVIAVTWARPRPVTTTTQAAADRRSSVVTALLGAVFLALVAYGLGYFAGYFLSTFHPELAWVRLPLGLLGVLAVGCSMIPWAVLKVRAAGRRRAVANGHPASPEVVDHAMKAANDASLSEAIRSVSPPRMILIFGGLVAMIVTLVVAMVLIPTLVNQLPGGHSSTPVVLLPAVQVGVVALVFALLLAMMIAYLVAPLIGEAKVEYRLSALSDRQRLQWQVDDRAKTQRPYRFPARLADPDRSIRVLTITDAGIRLEQLAAGSLIGEISEPLVLDDVELDELDGLDDGDDEDDELDAGELGMLRVLEALTDRAGDLDFDVFEVGYRRVVHVVAVTGDDYSDFPEELAAELSATV